jgi:hypothetical protein
LPGRFASPIRPDPRRARRRRAVSIPVPFRERHVGAGHHRVGDGVEGVVVRDAQREENFEIANLRRRRDRAGHHAKPSVRELRVVGVDVEQLVDELADRVDHDRRVTCGDGRRGCMPSLWIRYPAAPATRNITTA